MVDVPAAPQESGANEREILFMTEDDGAAGLRATLFWSTHSETVNGQRVGALGVAGLADHDEALKGYPVPMAGVYRSTPPGVGDGDVVTLLTDAAGRPLIVGAAAHDAAAAGNPVRAAGVYRATPAAIDDGDVGDLFIDAAGRLNVVVYNGVEKATGETSYNVTLASADTEYSQALPANTKRISFRCRTNYDVRFAFETGKVATPTAPYSTLKAGREYTEYDLDLAAVTLYLASSQAGVVVELECWT